MTIEKGVGFCGQTDVAGLAWAGSPGGLQVGPVQMAPVHKLGGDEVAHDQEAL